MVNWYFPTGIEKEVDVTRLSDENLIYYDNQMYNLWNKLEEGYCFDWTFLEVSKLHNIILNELLKRGMDPGGHVNRLDNVKYFLGNSPATYSIEKKYNGFHVSVHKKENEVKIFSEQRKDLTNSFPTLVEEIKKLSEDKFILDGELVPFDENGNQLGRNELMKYIGAIESGKQPEDKNIKLFVWDIPYYQNSLENLIFLKRIEFLKKLKFSDRVIETERKIIDNPNELEKAIKLASELKGSEGAIIKNAYSSYKTGENSDWVKFRNLSSLNVIVLKKNSKKDNLFNYLVGVISDKDYIDKSYVVNFKGNNYLFLGHTFNTKEDFNEGDKINILVEEIWRHENKNGVHYSIHKPRVNNKIEEQLDNIDKLEKIVTSIGVSIKHSEIENNEVLEFSDEEYFENSEEGKEIQVKNFPQKMQEDFKENMGKWNSYVMQVHTRGETLHYDIRHKVNDHLQGITLFGRSIKDRLKIENQRNNIRSTIKLPQPVEWLKFEGITRKGGMGATKQNPGVFTIISKGKYTIKDVTDHVIRIQYKSDKGEINNSINDQAEKEGLKYPQLPGDLIDLSGDYSWHIAHIGEDYIILFDRLKKE